MTPAQAAAIARKAGVRKCNPGDRMVSPRGETFYVEPTVIIPRCAAYQFIVNGAPMAVMIFRGGIMPQLRYCDREGRVHSEDIAGGTFEQQMLVGIARMAELTKQFLGERHPLASQPSLNGAPA